MDHVVNDEQQAYVDSTETLSVVAEPSAENSAALAFRPRFRPRTLGGDGRRFDFISSRIDTRDRFHFTYGTVSARLKLPAGSGLWPAFWAMGVGEWPSAGEIDVMENVGESDWVSCAVHGPGFSGESGLVNKMFFPGARDATDWHIYSVRWEPDQVVFDVDGLTVYRVTRPMVEFFGSWVFENEKFLILNFALGGTYPFKTNGVRSPYYGIPEETVAKIANDEVALLVDWVRVT